MTFLISFLLFQRVWYPSILLYHISGSQIVRDLFSPLFLFIYCSSISPWQPCFSVSGFPPIQPKGRRSQVLIRKIRNTARLINIHFRRLKSREPSWLSSEPSGLSSTPDLPTLFCLIPCHKYIPIQVTHCKFCRLSNLSLESLRSRNGYLLQIIREPMTEVCTLFATSVHLIHFLAASGYAIR